MSILRAMGLWILRLIPPIVAVAICLAGAALTLALLGFGREDGQSLWEGLRRIADVVHTRSMVPGRNYRYFIQTLMAATPILLTGLAVAVAFRASVLNIGAEGQYIAGAIAATIIGLHATGPRWLVLVELLVGGCLAGALLAAIAAILHQARDVPIVLSTLLLNFIAAVALKALLQGPLHEEGDQLQSEQLPEAARLPHLYLNHVRTQFHAGFFIAVGCAVLLVIVLRFTTFGFRLRATGENPIAARFAGIRTGLISIATLCLSGALAGLAGAIQISGVLPHQLLPDTASSGLGFAGIAVALLGRLSPMGVILAALFFGWLQTAFAGLEASNLHVPFLTLQATQGAILLAMLMLTQVRFRRLLKR